MNFTRNMVNTGMIVFKPKKYGKQLELLSEPLPESSCHSS